MEPTPKRQPPKGRIITFYSYKGGTGRSMALANVAWILALCGQRVLVVDWDLEAPGIHRYFHPLLEDKELAATEGLLDFVEKLETRAAMAKEPLGEEDVDVIEYVTMLKWPAGSSLNWKEFGSNAGIDLLSAGQQGPGYSAKLSRFDWIEFYEKLGGRRMLDIARRQLQGVYDYILIDSRTGVSDTSGICTVEMPDTLVVCFTLNEQSIIGASGIANSVRTQRSSRVTEESAIQGARPFRILPVPTRVEIGSERVKREVALAAAKRQFAGFVEGMSSKYWGGVQLPYFAFYAFEEIPAVFGDMPNDKLSLLTPIKEIAREITGDPTLEIPPLHKGELEAERLRQEVLSWYLRKGEDKAQGTVALTQKTWFDFDPISQSLMKKVMLRLLQVSPESPPSPLTCTMEEIEKPLHDMVAKLTTSGILQTSGAGIYIADRKVIESWDPLRQWIREDEAFLIWRQSIASAAQRWRATDRDRSGLLRGRLLDEAKEWRGKRPFDLTEDEHGFIEASDKARPLEISLPGTRRKVGLPVLASCILMCVVLLAVLTVSYLGNRALKSEIEEASSAVSMLSASPTSLPEDLRKLERLKQSLETLSVYRRDGIPWRLRWGLYSGARLEPAARSLYFGSFHKLLFGATQAALLDYLRGLPATPELRSDYGAVYDSLKAYLITTSNPDKSSQMFLSPVLMKVWSLGRTPDAETLTLVQKQFDFYSEELKTENPFSSESDTLLVEQTRKYLSRFEAIARAYQLMLAEAASKNAPVAFNRLFPGSAQVVLAAHEVGGAFTKAGWTFMQDGMKSLNYSFSDEEWVLGEQRNVVMDPTRLERELTDLYTKDFVRQWEQFLSSASIVSYENIKDAATKLNRLSSNQSPLLVLFCIVSQNTGVETPEIKNAFQPVHYVMPPECMEKYIGDSNAAYMNSLVDLAAWVEQMAAAPGTPTDASKVQALTKAAQAKFAARQLAQKFKVSAQLGAVVQKLMEDPITSAESLIRSQTECIVSLAVPADNALLTQRRRDNGIVELDWRFGWRACPGATRYHLFVIGSTALNPLIDEDSIPSATYDYSGRGGTFTQLEGWTWKVRALVDGRWGGWSKERTFNIAPPY